MQRNEIYGDRNHAFPNNFQQIIFSSKSVWHSKIFKEKDLIS